MEDLNKLHQKDEVNNFMLQDDLNEFAIISNIHLHPIYWTCGIFKTNYSNGVMKGAIITYQDLTNIFIQNYYHTNFETLKLTKENAPNFFYFVYAQATYLKRYLHSKYYVSIVV